MVGIKVKGYIDYNLSQSVLNKWSKWYILQNNKKQRNRREGVMTKIVTIYTAFKRGCTPNGCLRKED